MGGGVGRCATAEMIPSVGKQWGCVVSGHDHITGKGWDCWWSKHTPRHQSMTCAAAYLTPAQRHRQRDGQQEVGDILCFTLSLIQSVASLSLTQIHFPSCGRETQWGDTQLHAEMKATDDILISECWLTDLVSWDNAACHCITLLG